MSHQEHIQPPGRQRNQADGLPGDPANYSPIVSINRWTSLQYALEGLRYMVRYQKNVRIQAVAVLLVIFMGFWLQLRPLEWALLVVVMTVEITAEIINAAIEAVVNLVSPEWHPMAKVSKDVAAAAVLVAAVMSVIVGLLVLGPPLLSRLQQLTG